MHNDSSQVVKDILVKVPSIIKVKAESPLTSASYSCHTPFALLQADLQTSSQRLNLSASNSGVAELKPDSCIDDVIHHEVKEIGTHMYALSPLLQYSKWLCEAKTATCVLLSLVCAVSYTSQYGEKLYFRKFFKFQVRCVRAPLLASSAEVTCGLGGGLRNVTRLWQSEWNDNPSSGSGFLSCFWEVAAAFKTFSQQLPVCLIRRSSLNGHAVWENCSLQFAIYFQSGSEASGCEDKVLQRRGECWSDQPFG